MSDRNKAMADESRRPLIKKLTEEVQKGEDGSASKIAFQVREPGGVHV